MGKDPAFLFYANDWLGGTMGMSFEEKGAFMELLLMQFNTGKFTEAQAKHVLSICTAHVWGVVKHKFKTDGTFYWNERLANEIERRKKYTKSRRDNALSKKDKKISNEHMLQHMETETGIENINGNENKRGAGGKLTREEELAIYQKFTGAVLAHEDQIFEQLAMKEHFDITEDAVKDHLALLCRYPNMQPLTAAEFRQSLIKHCKEFKIKKDGTTKPRRIGTLDLDAAEREFRRAAELDEQERAKNFTGT